MAQTAAEMIAEVQRRCGRTGDTVLITAGQVATWLNEAQKDVVDRISGLPAVTYVNWTSLDTTQSLRYALGDLTFDYTAQTVSSVFNVFYMDATGNDCYRIFFAHEDEFNNEYYDATNANAVYDRPRHWTRQGQYLEMAPLCATGYCDKDLRVIGDFYPRDVAADSTELSDLSQGDEGLKTYALSKAWRDIGQSAKASDFSRQYENWLDGYESRNNRLDQWNGGMYNS